MGGSWGRAQHRYKKYLHLHTLDNGEKPSLGRLLSPAISARARYLDTDTLEIRAVITCKVASAYIVTVNADTVRLIFCLSPAVRAWLQHRQFATICNLSVTTCCSFLLWFGQRRGHRTGGDTLGRRWATRGCCIHYELW